MKSITQNLYFLILLTSLTFLLPGVSSAQSGQSVVQSGKSAGQTGKSDVTLTLKVPGICEMCKARIESTAMDVTGVKKAEWDMKTDTLVLVGSAKMDKQKIADTLAKAGYRSELAAADPKGYSKLPTCCQYDSGAKKE